MMQAAEDTDAVAPAGSTDQPTPFPLLSLPPELWSRICIEAATSTSTITVTRPDRLASTARAVHQPAITRVCRAIRAETLSAFYRCTELCFEDHYRSKLVGLAKWVGVLIKAGKWAMVATCILRSNDPDVESYLRAVLKKRAGVKKSDVRLVRLSMGSRSPRSRRPARTFVFKLKTVQAAEASDSERQLSDRYPPILVPT